MVGVMTGLGHSVRYQRGEVIYGSPNLFGKLMFIRSGVVAKALIDPVRDEPLMLSLGTTGALCGSYENLYVNDRLPRRHYCLTTSEVLVVNQELLLKIADQNADWQQELANYASYCALCDRLGMLVNRAGSLEQRFGALMVLLQSEMDPEIEKNISSTGIDWMPLFIFPAFKSMSIVLDSDATELHEVVRNWNTQGIIRRRAGKLWVKRAVFHDYWRWLQRFVQQNA